MADWYLASSLKALFSEINARWPGRDTDSDGTIGNAAHAARVSDHNPDWSAGGVVRAIDVDSDGINVPELLAATVGNPRVWYVIWNHRIASATDDGKPWDWEPYDGDPHTGHVHISIKHTRMAETDTSPWFGRLTEEDDYMSTPEAKAQLDRIEKMLTALTSAETGRYADMARRVQTLTTAEASRYQYYAGRFGAIMTELADDPVSPVEHTPAVAQ